MKTSGHEKPYHRGPARVFDREEDAMDAAVKGQIKKGDVVIVRYEGPRGGPGMREMLGLTAALVGLGLGEDVALLDRRALQRRDARPDGRARRSGSRARRAYRNYRRGRSNCFRSRDKKSAGRIDRRGNQGAPRKMESACAAL